jgi:hypothetical protein
MDKNSAARNSLWNGFHTTIPDESVQKPNRISNFSGSLHGFWNSQGKWKRPIDLLSWMGAYRSPAESARNSRERCLCKVAHRLLATFVDNCAASVWFHLSLLSWMGPHRGSAESAKNSRERYLRQSRVTFSCRLSRWNRVSNSSASLSEEVCLQELLCFCCVFTNG